MPPKNERLEIRIDPELSQSISDWTNRQDEHMPKSEAVRRLILMGLDNSESGDRPVTISDGERLIIQMLFDLQKDPNHREIEQKPLMEAIYGGHFWALEWEMTGLLHRHRDDKKSVRHVVDVLDMWNFIEQAWDKFSDAEKTKVREAESFGYTDPVFSGFDGNNESELMGIASHMVNVMGRFSRFADRSLNSHFPTRVKHGGMLQKFLQIRPSLTGRGLSPSEMIEIFDTARRIEAL